MLFCHLKLHILRRSLASHGFGKKVLPQQFCLPPVRDGKRQLIGISHLVCCPRPAWVAFVILCLLHKFASHFSSPPSVFVRRGWCFDAILGSNTHFLPDVKTPPPLLPWFSSDSFHFSFIRLLLLVVAAVRYLPEWPGTTLSALPLPPSGRLSYGNGEPPSPRS